MSRRGSSESLSSRDSTDEPCLQNPGPSSLSEALLLSTLPPQALAVMRHHRERLIEFTKCTTITEVNRNAIEMNSDGSPTALDGCSVQVTSMGGTEPAEIRIEYSHDEEQVNGTTVVIEETHHYPPVSLNGEEIIETRITDEVVIESEPYFWEPSYSRRDANVIDLHFAAANQQTHQSHLLSEEETNTSKTASVHIKGAGRTQESPAMESSLDQPNMAEKRPLSREDSNKFYRQSPSQSSDDDLVYAGDGEEQGSTKRGRSSEKEEGRLQQPPSKKKYMITGVHVSPSNTLTKGKRISSESGSNNTSVSVNEENQSLQAGITSVEMNSSMESVESQPRPAHRRKWNIKEHQMHLQPNNLIENGGVKMGNGTVKREVEEKVTVLGEIGKHQRGGSTGIKIGQTIEAEEVNHTVQAPPKPPRWKIVDVRSEEDLGKPVTHSTPISTIEKKAREYRNRKTSTEFIDSELQRIIDTVDTAFVNEAITNSRRTSTSPIVVVDQNPSRRSSGANVLDAAEKEREEKKRKSTINDIDWVAAFAMKEPATPKSPRTLQLFQTPVSLSVVEENKDRQFLDVEEDNNRGKMRRLSAPETLKNKLPPSKIDLSEVFACTKGQKTDEKKCGCNACRLTRMSDRDMMRIAEERRRMHEESKAAKQIQSHTLPRRQQKRFSTEISLDEIFATAPSKPTVATPARQEPEQSAIVDSSDYFTDLITAPSTSSNRLDVHIPTRNDDFSNRVENIQATAGRDQTPEKIDPKELSYPMVSSAQTGNENESNHMSSTINHNHNQQYQQGQDQSDHNLLDLVFVGLPEPKRVERPHASSNEGYRKDWNQTEQSWIENVVNSAILSATISKSSDDILKDESGKQTETEPFIEMRQKKPDNGRRTTQSTYTLTSVKDRVAEYERRESEADKNKSMNDLDWIKNMMDTPKKLQTESEDSGIHRASLFHIVDSNEHVDQKPNEDEKFGDSGIYQSSLVHIEGSNESIESKEENILNKASFSHTNDSSTNRNQKESNPESSHLKDWIESLVIEQVTVATATVSRQLPTTDPISPTIIKESLGSDEKESTNQPRRASYLYAEEPEMKEDGSSTTTNEWVTEMLTKENANTSTETEGGQRDSPDSVKEEEDYIIESEEYKLPVASSGQNEEDVTNNPEQWIEAMKLGPGDDVQMKRKNSQRHFSNEDDDDEPRYYEFLNDSIALRKKHSLNLDEEETRKISLKYLKNTRTNLHENSRFLAELPKSQSQKELKFSEQLNEAEERINQNDEDRVQVDLMELVFTTSRTEDEYKSTETPSSFEFTSTTSTTTYNPLTQYLSSDTQNDSNDEIESQPQKSPTSPNGGSKTERLIEQEITYMLPYSYHDGSLHSRSTSDGDHNLPYSDISLDDVFAFQSRKPEQKTSEHRKQDSKGEASYHEAAERIIDEAFEDVFPATSSLPKSSHKVTPELNYSAAETRSVLAAEDKVRENNKSIASRPSSREQNSYEYYESTSVEPYRASSSARDTTNQTDVKYLSSARIHLNDTQTSSEPDEEYFARLIQENGERTVDTYKMERKMVVEREDEEEQTMSRYEAHRHFQTLTRDFSENGEEKEALEIIDKPSHYLIKGIYSLVVSKADDLGKLLEQHKQEHGDSVASLDFSVSNRLRNLLRQCLKEKAIRSSGRHGTLDLSPRALRLVSTEDPADDVYTRMLASPYHPIDNPTGNINFCTACNDLCTELVRPKLEEEHGRIYHAAAERMTRYPTLGGYSRTKEAVAAYLSKWNNASVSPSNIVLVPSGNAAYDLICHCVFEDNDVLLAPAPTYSKTVNNCADRAEVHVETVELDLISPSLEIRVYQKKLEEFRLRGRNVRGLNLINPHNPTGWIFPKEQIIRLCDWAARSGLFVIIDEIFSSCIHDPDAQFDSFLSYRNKLTNPEKVIYVWSPSKDFGLPGTKLATIHTEMPALLKSLNRLSSISPVSTMAEDFIVKLLSDGEFLTSFKRQMVSRLRAHFSFIAEHLKRLKIAFVPASAAIFVLIDLRKHLSRSSFEAEDELMHKLEGVGLYLTPGSHMEALQPGYFRLVFACSKEELKEGICRLYKFLGRDSSGVQDIEYEQ